MSRHDRARGVWHITRSRGRKGRNGLGTYSRRIKRQMADRYTRPYITGEYRKWGGYQSTEV